MGSSTQVRSRTEKFNCQRCACCNQKVWEFWFGKMNKKPRRTHGDVVLEKRRKAEAIAGRRELYARVKLEREAKAQRRKIALS